MQFFATIHKKLLIALFGLTIGVLLVVLLPRSRYSLAGVDPTLRGLAMPYQSVNLVNWSDGSIGVRILDRSGRQLKLALPIASLPGKSRFQRLLVGVEHSSHPGASEVPFSEDTRQLLIATMERYRNFSDSTDIILLRFRGAPRDYARWWFKNAVQMIQNR